MAYGSCIAVQMGGFQSRPWLTVKATSCIEWQMRLAIDNGLFFQHLRKVAPEGGQAFTIASIMHVGLIMRQRLDLSLRTC